MMELNLHPVVTNLLNGASDLPLQCFLLFVFSMLPITECRLTIPFGILVFGLPWYLVLPICVISNSLIGVFLVFALDWLISIFSKITFFKSIKSGSYFQAKREEDVTSRHYFVRAKSTEFNSTSNDSYYETTSAGTKRIIPGLASEQKTYITSVGLYNDDNELLAIAKLSQPILKSKSREALIKVKLDF